MRDPLFTHIVVARDDLPLQRVVEGGGIRSVVGALPSDHPAVASIKPLRPPAVQRREVQRAVDRRLHPAGTACLHRDFWVVEPEIHAPHQRFGDPLAIILHKGDPPAKARILRGFEDMLEDLLARIVRGVRLACEDDLHRSGVVVDDLLQPVEIMQDQIGAFVGGHAPGEADRQDIGIEHHPLRHRDQRIDPLFRPLAPYPLTDEVYHPHFVGVVQIPNRPIIQLFDPLPDLGQILHL